MRALYLAWIAIVVAGGVYGMTSGHQGGLDAVGWVLFMLAAAAWPLPVAIAAARAHPSTPAIAVLDLLLGWTAIGWLAALAWSMTRPIQILAEEAGGAARDHPPGTGT